MNITEFRKSIKPNCQLMISGKKFTIREIIKFRLDDGSYYIKCFLSDGYVFADDEENNYYILVKEFPNSLTEPFPKAINYQGKDYKFLYDAHAIAEEIEGEQIFKKDDSEKFWDYKANDGSYISLGIDDSSKQRADFIGKIIQPKDVEIILAT